MATRASLPVQMPFVSHEPPDFDFTVDVAVIGAGACGLCAGLAAADAGAEVLVIERDASAMGSTAMSTGLIPAAGVQDQLDLGIDDSAALFFDDIMQKSHQGADAAVVRRLAETSADTVTWLREAHAAPLSLVSSFLYPGHSRMRMFGTPNRTGVELQSALEAALLRTSAHLMTSARVETIYTQGDRMVGVGVVRPGGAVEPIGCRSLIMACCGYGGNPQLVGRWIPEMAQADYYGHPGNTGDAVLWGEALGAELADMSAYQGHGGLAAGYGVPILWPVIVEGGFQVNRMGVRFSDESAGYSEQAAKVNAQPGHVAWTIFDERLHRLLLEFHDYQEALSAGAVVVADTWRALAQATSLPAAALEATVAEVALAIAYRQPDRFGRLFANRPVLGPPLRAVKVTGVLFHTQGGLAIDPDARVLRKDGGPFPNLFAGGGAARGVSGSTAAGYIAGNGLLTATSLGKLAGRAAAAQVLAGA